MHNQHAELSQLLADQRITQRHEHATRGRLVSGARHRVVGAGHLPGDRITQSDWQATTKTRSRPPRPRPADEPTPGRR